MPGYTDNENNMERISDSDVVYIKEGTGSKAEYFKYNVKTGCYLSITDFCSGLVQQGTGQRISSADAPPDPDASLYDSRQNLTNSGDR